MYHHYDNNNNNCECSSEITSESEDNSLCGSNTCMKCRMSKFVKADSLKCSRCEYKQKKVLTKGKFGLAYVIETPKKKITKPTGWQIEFEDTPSRIDNNCEKMVKWINCPPLNECNDAMRTFRECPKSCAKLLTEYKCRRSKSPKCHYPVKARQANKDEDFECCCVHKDRLCIICEKCKVDASTRTPSPKLLCSEKKLPCDKRCCEEAPAPHSCKYKEDKYCKTRKYKNCCCDDSECRVFKNKHCCCRNPDELKCKYCNREMIPDVCCDRCCDPTFFREKENSDFKYYKARDDLDYIPKKEKSASIKNTQTNRQQCVKVCDKEVDAKNGKEFAPFIRKVETNTVIAVKFMEKGTAQTSDTKPVIIIERGGLGDAAEKRSSTDEPPKESEISEGRSSDSKMNADKSHDVEMQLQEIIYLNNKTSKEEAEQETDLKKNDEFNENPIEKISDGERQQTKQPLENLKIVNLKKKSKNKIFTDDMTPMQKIQLALKIQKLTILESKR